MSNPHYTFDFKTQTGTGVAPAGIVGLFFYDTGEVENGLPVYYDTDGVYAKWSDDGTRYVFTAVADVGGALLDYFAAVGSDWMGYGAWLGTFKTSTILVSDAWYRAETTVFDSLTAFVGGDEGNNCFRGFLPVQGDGEDLKFVNVWQLSSGGSSEFDMGRLFGNDPAWCSMRNDIELESIWKTREEAMAFSGAVMAWLQQTDNMSETDSVDWCSLSEVPKEPEIYRTAGANRQRYWRQVIDLEVVYSTATEHA